MRSERRPSWAAGLVVCLGLGAFCGAVGCATPNPEAVLAVDLEREAKVGRIVAFAEGVVQRAISDPQKRVEAQAELARELREYGELAERERRWIAEATATDWAEIADKGLELWLETRRARGEP